jgi:hypothetical protein
MTTALEVASSTPRPYFTPGKDPVPIVQEAGWVPGPVWTGAENLASTRIRSPDRPARSQSLYRLSYRAPDTSIGPNNDASQLQVFTPCIRSNLPLQSRQTRTLYFSIVPDIQRKDGTFDSCRSQRLADNFGMIFVCAFDMW